MNRSEPVRIAYISSERINTHRELKLGVGNDTLCERLCSPSIIWFWRKTQKKNKRLKREMYTCALGQRQRKTDGFGFVFASLAFPFLRLFKLGHLSGMECFGIIIQYTLFIRSCTLLPFQTGSVSLTVICAGKRWNTTIDVAIHSNREAGMLCMLSQLGNYVCIFYFVVFFSLFV